MKRNGTDRHAQDEQEQRRHQLISRWARHISHGALEVREANWFEKWLIDETPPAFKDKLTIQKDYLPKADERLMEATLLRMWFSKKGWEWVERSGDKLRVLDVIARTKLAARDWKSFEEDEFPLSCHILRQDVWYWKGRALNLQRVNDLQYAANTIWLKVEPTLNDDQKDTIARRKEQGMGKRAISGKELSDEILALLKSRRFEDFTYNQVATELNVEWKEASKSLKWLSRHPKPREVVVYEVRNGDKKSVRYKYCPERAAIEDGRGNPMSQMVQAVVRVLLRFGALGKRELRESVRRYMGRADNSMTDEAIRILWELGAVERTEGARGKTTYRRVKGFSLEEVRPRYKAMLQPWEPKNDLAEAC